MRSLLLTCLLFTGSIASAQDLTGIWRGHFISDNRTKLQDSLGTQDKYKFEVQLGQTDKVFEAVTYSYQTTVFYGKAAAQGAINKQTKKVLLQETKIVEMKSISGGACIMTLFMQYSKIGNDEFLEGKYTGINITDSSFCGTGTVFLRKVPVSDFYKEPFLVEREKKKVVPATPKKPSTPSASVAPRKVVPVKPPKPKAPPIVSLPEKSKDLKPISVDTLRKISSKIHADIPVPKVISSRKNEIVKTIATAAKEVFIKIYDNGSIDNDTVSVYIDNRLIVSKQKLTEKAIVVKLKLNDEANEHELVMVAENLGEIPPNTSLMVVSAGDETYEVRITSTEQKNAVVVFKYIP